MRHKFVYSCRVKNPCFKIWWTLGKHFLPSVGSGSICPAKRVVKMLQVVVVGWWVVRWIWQMSRNFLTQFLQLLKLWLGDLWSVIVMEKDLGSFLLNNAGCRHWGFHCISSVCWVYFSDVMGFCQDSESYSGSDGQQTTKQWPLPLLVQVGALGSALEFLLGPVTELIIASCINSTFHHTSQSDWEMVHSYCIE